jgi:hypothetical protein
MIQDIFLINSVYTFLHVAPYGALIIFHLLDPVLHTGLQTFHPSGVDECFVLGACPEDR